MAEAMGTGWYCMQGGATGQQVGPLTWEQLYGLRSSGSLQSGDLVWHPTMPQWMPAGQIPGLFPEQAAQQAAVQPAAYQQAPYQQPAYQQAPYQQAAQPAYGDQGVYQPAAPKRSRLWLWLGPLIAVVLIGIAAGVYFGFFYDKGISVEGGDASIPLTDLYGTWEGTLTYESLDIDEDKLSAADAALLEKVLNEDVPMTVELAGLGDKGTATMTMDFTVIDSDLKKVTEEMAFTYSDGQFTFESEASGDKVAAAVNEKSGDFVLDGVMQFTTDTHSGEAVWTATKQ